MTVHSLLLGSLGNPVPDCSPIAELFLDVAAMLKAHPEPTIDHIFDELILSKSLSQITDEDSLDTSRGLVFAILGWQTMLFQPSLGTCPPQQLSVVDDFDGHQGQAFMAFEQNTSEAKKRLDDFLMGFGLLIPPRNTCISEDFEERQAFDSIFTVEPEQFSSFVLKSIAHIHIRWTDCLAVHLEYHKATNTLYLFRYPSFCAASLSASLKGDSVDSVIYRSV